MLTPQEVAKDESIFRPDGFIKFPRTDGDSDFGPPNTLVPSKTDLEVNYYHIFGREEKKHDQWRAALGEHLATFFKLSPLSRSKTKWKLYDFPEHYYFTEQRKGPAHDFRTDPYLFGSHGHRFRSTREAVDHFVWLLCDPDLNNANCRCKYCHKTPRTLTGADRTPKKMAGAKRKEPVSASAAAGKVGRPGKSQREDAREAVQKQTSITVRGVEMKRLVPGLTVASVPQREQELMHELKRGEKERFRVGEMVWCRLDKPVVDPTDSSRQISQWPAVIVDPTIDVNAYLAYDAGDEKDQKTSVEAVSAPSKSFESPPLIGGSSSSLIHQSMAYQATFFGTMETVRAPETLLTPYLAGLIPSELIESNLGACEDHPWLFNAHEMPHLNLSRQPDLPEPNFTKAIVAFGFAAEAVAVLRNLYNLTDAYSASDDPEQVLGDLGASATDGGKQLRMRYYQGIYFGLERLWVGDVVRLRLSKGDVRKLQNQLNATLVAERQPGAPEPSAILLDEDGSYVLQLAAIYEDPRATKTTIRVVGEIYQIMTQAKYNALKAGIEANIKRLETDDSLDAAAREEEAKQLEARLPKPSILTGKPGFPAMPPLPPGFVMISLNDRMQTRIPRETTLSIGHVAGRIYPSLGMHSDGPRVAEQIQQAPSDKRLAADEDTQVELRARLSVAGLLSGCVKAMRGSSVHTWTRTASFKGALVIARRKLVEVMTGNFDDLEELTTASPAKTPAKVSKAAIGDEVGQTQSQAGKPAADGPATSEAPSQSQQASTAAAVSEQQRVAAATGGTVGDADMPPSPEEDPPLAPGWVPRKSRNLGSYYYVHTVTKQTQWERPTA